MMKRFRPRLAVRYAWTVAFFAAALCVGMAVVSSARGDASASARQSRPQVQSRRQVLAALNRAAAAQLAAYGGKYDATWVSGVFYDGLIHLNHAAPEPTLDAALADIGHSFQFRLNLAAHPFSANEDCVGRVFIADYAHGHNPAALRHLQTALDRLCLKLNADKPGQRPTWWWCDALYMAAPVMAQLGAVSQHNRYTKALAHEWAIVADELYDSNQHLFYRDKRFVGRKGPAGEPIFWSRGNGWVLAGLA